MDKNEALIHYGTPRHSGRYPWGSGENPYQHQMDFRSKVLKMRAQGMSDKEIQDKLGVKSTEFRATMSVGKTAQRDEDRRRALYLKDKGYSNVAIGEKMGINESSVRGLLNENLAERNDRLINTSNKIKEAVDKNGMVDIGKGVGLEIGVSDEHLKAAVSILKQQGYNIHEIYIPQVTDPLSQKATTQKILTKPDVTRKDVFDNLDKVSSLTMYTPDRGKTYAEVRYPESIKSDRVKIRYSEEGGKAKDGVIEIRPGVEDLSLGDKHYAQVRIAVDNSHFLKGMAIYGDPKKFPDGVDVIFNTNKHVGTNKMDVLKPFKTDGRGNIDKTNPFGALLRAGGQTEYIGKDGKKHLSAINIVKQEGDWAEQARTVASQMLAKQSLPLIKKQLALSLTEYQSDFDEINSITNPSVRQKLLYSFADKCDKAAAHLKATSFPRQQTQVILPVDSLKDNEIYAPNYRNGETVALIRYPHAGPFEIPVLKVNNKNTEGRRAVGTSVQDAVGINTRVAEILSGADFDGDTVSVIPVNNRIKLIDSSNSNAIKIANYMKGFDPKEAYPYVEGMKVMTAKNKQTEMGKISNLITDMTLKGAKPEEIARADKHSMVVIDSEKHKLNYQQSYIDNGIKALKIKYQGVNEKGQPKGASTLISQAKAETRIPLRSMRFEINKETGEKTYFPSNRPTYVNKNGETKTRIEKVERMSQYKDAFELSSGFPQETEYAKYANSLKALANRSRKEAINIKPIERNPSAAKIYAEEVASLSSKLNQSLKNAPKERMAQRIATVNVNRTIQEFKNNPNIKELSKDEKNKLRQTSIANARASVSAGRSKITEITDKEWEAIQSGAISKTKLDRIMNAFDEDALKKRAMPKNTRTIPQSKKNRIETMLAAGWTQQEIADSLGVSVSTVRNIAHPSE